MSEIIRSMLRNVLGLLLAGSLLVTGCQSEYERMLEEELASGERHDSLFLGLHFGMSRKDFFVHCWRLNRDSVIRQGLNNSSVLYELEDELGSPAAMNFYPNFVDTTIHEMPVIFSYEGWAPWNKGLSSDSLLVEVLELLQAWHGGREFLKIESPGKRSAYVKIDGNRRILVHPKGEQDVRVLYTDMGADTDQLSESSRVESR